MQVILEQDIPNLGKKGELKDVARGYARNHLLPRGLAVEATPHRLREWDQRQEKEEALNRELEDKARKQAEKLLNKELLFKMPAGDGGRLFGSVTAADVAGKLVNEGFDIDKKKIELSEQIKSVGNYTAEIKLHSGVKAEILVKVEAEE
ncbi:MAG: 50S ribosomal protein L9 [Bacillota bacterium]